MTPIEILPITVPPRPTHPPMPPCGGLELILIQVPHVRFRDPLATLAWPRPTGFQRRNAPAARPRRRLKPGVRLAGRILGGLLLAGLFLNCCTALGLAYIPARKPQAQADRSRGVPGEAPRPPASTRARPTVVLSIEPAGPSIDEQEGRPVILPGYLLPDDSREEAAHEGS